MRISLFLFFFSSLSPSSPLSGLNAGVALVGLPRLGALTDWGLSSGSIKPRSRGAGAYYIAEAFSYFLARSSFALMILRPI